MIVRNVQSQSSNGNLHQVAWGLMDTVRLILADDATGFSVSDVTVKKPMDVVLQYKHHIEANIFLEGGGTVENLTSGEIHEVSAELRQNWADSLPNIAREWAAAADGNGLPGSKVLEAYMDMMRDADQPIARQWDKE